MTLQRHSRNALVLLSVLLLLCTSACDSTGADGSRYAVEYAIAGSGDAAVTSITYRTSEGTRTEGNPALPWSKSFTMRSGDRASVFADGTVNAGEFTVTLLATDNDGFLINLNTKCSGENPPIPKTCTDVGLDETLP